MEEHPQAGLLPNPAEDPGTSEVTVEEAEIQDNLGEFPDRLADQGDWRQTPVPRHSPRRHKEEERAPTKGEAP